MAKKGSPNQADRRGRTEEWRETAASDPRNPGILLAVSRLYYEQDLSKTRIADLFGTSVTQVVRWLERAKGDGIVQFMFNPPRFAVLEERLMARFDCLREVIVAAIPEGVDYRTHIELLGRAAAGFFERNATENSRVAISGGSTLAALIEALPLRQRQIQIFPTAIIGRGPHIGEHIDPMVTVTLLWAKCGRLPDMAYYATVPPYDGRATWETAPENKLDWLKIEKVRAVWEGMQGADLVVASLGPVDAPEDYFEVTGPTIIREVSELGVEVEWLHEQGIVGDINYSFFDANGQSKAAWDFFLSIPITVLRNMAADRAKKVALVAGRHKLACLRAALRGRLCSVLITDDVTAAALIA
jgi:DNA-binding transcriptional regulator LsrR (DeoR family)